MNTHSQGDEEEAATITAQPHRYSPFGIPVRGAPVFVDE